MSTDRLSSFGADLAAIHHRLRADLRALQSGAAVGRDLKTHCLTFCSALTAHHTGEDGGAFVALAREFPELAPTIAKLEEDHRMIAGIQERIVALVEGGGDYAGELDGLAAIMESHFRYEERTITEALNELREGTTEGLLGLPAEPLA
ncbi:hypothetical protein Afil01_54070 [Actinorhabdospora filicis]|uniref:Hemerythrin-like domain-containing protein n=1 Tax=Actinorhabdospora filicis TaxID=1785913 RepID=A0A9W6WD96_9ACTN|nr:hemerythrin domain-containing protein [Actinorhabdospora filicis]GLZ80600.1 hypothetical protein Afil01_54070 [Actinorhabdospora filicis]